MLAEYVKALKTKKNITSEALAKEAGVSPTFLSRILSGAADNPEWKSIVPVIKALGGSLDEAAGLKPAALDSMTALQQRLQDQQALIENYEKRLSDHREVITSRHDIFERQAAEQKAAYEERIKDLKESAADYKTQLTDERRENRTLRRVILGLIAALVLVCYLFVDSRNPEWGIFQDATANVVTPQVILWLLAGGAVIVITSNLLLRVRRDK